ncbi:hypothetical protein [Chryseobacterium shandongense]|nr:hypothetical protein [Chryseobacterium shandongense]
MFIAFFTYAKMFIVDSNTPITITIFDNDFIIITFFGNGALANPFLFEISDKCFAKAGIAFDKAHLWLSGHSFSLF